MSTSVYWFNKGIIRVCFLTAPIWRTLLQGFSKHENVKRRPKMNLNSLPSSKYYQNVAFFYENLIKSLVFLKTRQSLLLSTLHFRTRCEYIINGKLQCTTFEYKHVYMSKCWYGNDFNWWSTVEVLSP